jgi:Flp pilus assembly protein CpaB
MARSVTSMAAGRSNRRYVVLAVVLALLSAVLVYATLSRAGGESGSGAGEVQTVVVAKEAIPARSEITSSMVALRQVAINARADQALSSTDDVVGRVTRYPVAANEQILTSKIVSPELPLEGDALSYIIPEGMRAVSISTNQVLSAGGLILPGDYVDILGVFNVEVSTEAPTSPEQSAYYFSMIGGEKETLESFYVWTILQNVEVVAVAQTIVDVVPVVGEEDGEAVSAETQRTRNTEDEPLPDAVTITMLVTPEQAELLFLAELNGTLRAVVRGFGDSEEQDIRPVTELELLPSDLPLPYAP